MNVSRRNFLLGSAAVTGFSMFGGCSLFNGPVAKVARGQKIRLAVCGIMGKGFTDWLPMIQSGLAEIVAWCDADTAMRLSPRSARNWSADMSFVKLQRPFAVISTFEPSLALRSMRTQFTPLSAATDAANIPAAPPPIIASSTGFVIQGDYIKFCRRVQN